MPEAVIVSAARTAIGTFGGALANTKSTELGALAVKEAIGRAGIEASDVEEVILGNVLAANLGLNPARVAAIASGVPQEVPSYGVNKACGSGLKAVSLAEQSIRCGDAEVVVAGGMENMSQAPFVLWGGRSPYRFGQKPYELVDMLMGSLYDTQCDLYMAQTAEKLAQRYGISREAQDEFALQSHLRGAAAVRDGRFAEEIVPIEILRKEKSLL